MSTALDLWTGRRSPLFGLLDEAREALKTGNPGRQWKTDPINRGCVLLMVAEFQGYCSDVHTLAIEHLIAPLPVADREAVRSIARSGRKLDVNNPNLKTINHDFEFLCVTEKNFYQELLRAEPKAKNWNKSLTWLLAWRNVYAHSDFDKPFVSDPNEPNPNQTTLLECRDRINKLVVHFDRVVGDNLTALTKRPTW